MRFMLAVDDDHSEFLRRFADDPLVGRATRQLRGMRPLRTATVAHALLRAVAGQLITSRRARAIERSVVRASTRRLGDLHGAPTAAEPRALLAGRAPRARPRRPARRRRSSGSAAAPISKQLKGAPDRGRGAAPRARARASGRGRPASSACRGSAATSGASPAISGSSSSPPQLWGRRVEAEETDALLEPYGEWAGLASVYLLAGYGSGLVGLRHENRDPRRRQDRRVAPRRAA